MENLDQLYAQFRNYVATFYCDDESIMYGIRLKEEHSIRVANYTKGLSAHLNLPPRHMVIAEAIGLLHDLQRFRQWQDYRTFADSLSFDHGDEAALFLEGHPFLAEFSPKECGWIRFAVRHHNKISIPQDFGQEEKMFAAIVRDVDKIDILRVIPPIEADHEYSPQLLTLLGQQKQISYLDVKTKADKRLVRVSWLYDINFPWTVVQLVKGHDVEKLLAMLPITPEFDQIRDNFRRYIATRLTGTKWE